MKRDSGFTTLELVVVCAIIGVLSMAYLSLSKGNTESARLQTLASDYSEIVKAANTWRESQGSALFTGISIGALTTANLFPRSTNADNGSITVAASNNNRSITITQAGIKSSPTATNLVTLITARGGKNVTKTGSGPYSVSAEF